MPGSTIRFLPLVIAACLLTTVSIALTAQAEEPGVSQSVVLTNEPGTLQVDAEWAKSQEKLHTKFNGDHGTES